MTWFDGIVIGVILISSVLALLRGFTNEVLSILAWIVGAVAALWLFPYLSPILRDFIPTPWLAAVVSAILIFFAAYAVVALFTSRWSDSLMEIHDRAALLDRTLGFVFGLARGLLVVAVAYLFFAWLVPDPVDQPGWIRNAKLRPMVESTASLLFTLAPEETRRPRFPDGRGGTAAQPIPKIPTNGNSGTTNSDADKTPPPGYNSSERRGLDRLFESTTGE